MTQASADSTSATVEALARRLALLEHQRDIADLTATYNDAWDTGDIDSWLRCFVADGEFIQKGVPQTKGHDALRAMISAMLPAGLVHLTTNHHITVGEDGTAEQRARVILGRRSLRRAPGSSTWETSGWYQDRLALTDTGWKFVSRTFNPDASLAGLPAWW